MAEMASFTIDHVVLLIGLSLLYFPRQRLRCGGERARRNERQLKTADKNDFDSNVREAAVDVFKAQVLGSLSR